MSSLRKCLFLAFFMFTTLIILNSKINSNVFAASCITINGSLTGAYSDAGIPLVSEPSPDITNSTNVRLLLNYVDIATYAIVSNDPTSLQNVTSSDSRWFATKTGGYTFIDNYKIADGADGIKTVYAVFKTNSGAIFGYNGIPKLYSDYTTLDTTAPVITNAIPANNSTNIPPSSPFTITFSETISPGANWSTIKLTTGTGSPVAITPTISGNVLTVKPNSTLQPSTTYKLYIPASSVKDIAGNGFPVNYYPTFTTQAPAPPTPTFSVGTVVNGQVQITINYSPECVVKQYRTGSSYSAYTQTILVGPYTTVYARGQNSSGAWSQESSYTVKEIDTTPPADPIITPSAGQNNLVNINISFSPDSKLKYYKIGTGSYKEYTGFFSTSPNTIIYAKARDYAGNWSNEVSFLVKTPLPPVYAGNVGDYLIPNYSFESGIGGWAVFSSNTTNASVSQEKALTGVSSLKITNTNASTNFVEGTKIKILPSQKYVADTNTFTTNGTSILSIRFYDGSNNVLSTTDAKISSPSGKWIPISIKAIAPSNAVYATILLSSINGTVYFDNVYFTKEITNLGAPITMANIAGGAFSKDLQGINYLYTVLSGEPAKFVVVNLNTEKVERIIDMPGGVGSWALTKSTDGKIYVGAYNNPSHLYQYSPGATSIIDLGQVSPSVNFIWDIIPGKNGEIYGGSYSKGYVFKYSPVSGFSQVGPSPFYSSEAYVRSIAYDSKNEIIYAGIGSHAHLIKYDLKTGLSKDILPSTYATEEFVYNLNVNNGKLFAELQLSGKVLVIDLATEKVEAVISDVTTRSISPSDSKDLNKVYYISKGHLYYYDIPSKTTHLANGTVAVGGFKMEFVDFGTDHFLFILNGGGLTHKYNIRTGEITTSNLPMPKVPTKVNSLAKGPDGNIYSSGYLFGGMGVYTPLRSDQSFQNKALGQAEGITSLGNKVYFGVYPGGKIVSYDTTKPTANPQFIFKIGYEQDRPYAMANGEGKIFIGSYPDYGKLGGALTIFDPMTNTHTTTRNVVQDQSIVSLVYKDGKLYGGTNIRGGLGSEPTQLDAKFFVWDVKTNSKDFEMIPVIGGKSITALTVGPDGNIWGMDEGNLFIYSPTTKSIIFTKNIFPAIKYTAKTAALVDAFLEIGKDGNVYGTMSSAASLFKINPTTKEVTILSNNARFFAQDNYGNLYYSDGYYLYRYAF